MTDLTTQHPQQHAPAGTSRAGVLWLIQAVSGLLLIAVLLLHMIAHHFVVEGGLRTFADVLAYVSNPAIFILEIVFLVVVTSHAMLGLRAIVLDLSPGPRARNFVDALLALVGIGAIVYATWLALAIQQL